MFIRKKPWAKSLTNLGRCTSGKECWLKSQIMFTKKMLLTKGNLCKWLWWYIMAVKDDFLGYREQCRFGFHFCPLSRVMYIDCFWLSLSLLVERTLQAGWRDVSRNSWPLCLSLASSPQKTKTKHCYVICFIIWSSRLPDRPIKRKLEWRGRAPISWLEVLLPMGRGIQRKMITMTLLSPFSPLTKLLTLS